LRARSAWAVRRRTYSEWAAAFRRGHVPLEEPFPGGFLLRFAREEVDLTQAALARKLRCSQQAVAQAERRRTNPTLTFLRRWAKACGRQLTIEIR
jgi:DNA-binding XRE family transcriptional regulator